MLRWLLLAVGVVFAGEAMSWEAAPEGEVQKIPALRARVTDLTGTLSEAERLQLEQKLAAFEQSTGSQIAVLLMPTVRPESIEQFGIRLAEAWKVGRKGIDDGAILIIAKADKKARIEVGRGFEGALTDATSRRILTETIYPHFKQGQYAAGIAAGLEQMIKVVSGEALPPPRPDASRRSGSQKSGDWGSIFGMALIAAAIAGGILRWMLGRLLGSVVGGVVAGGIAYLLISSLVAAIGVGLLVFVFILLWGSGGGWWWGGGGGGSSGGSSGWSGGGGDFGGGGASASWD